jgi:hypothetical protein
MICPQEITDEIIELFEAHPSERIIIQYHIHRLIIRSAISGESMVESLRQFVQRGGRLKGENPGMILQTLGMLANRGIAGQLAGDHLFGGKCIQDSGVFIGGISADEALHAFDTLSGNSFGRPPAGLADALERLKLAPVNPQKPKRKPFWKL